MVFSDVMFLVLNAGVISHLGWGGASKRVTPSWSSRANQDDSVMGVCVNCKKSELRRHTFLISNINLTILDFKEKNDLIWAFSNYKTAGSAGITIRLENRSHEFVTFSPSKLIFQESDGYQVMVVKEEMANWSKPAMDTILAPGGCIKHKFILTKNISLPVKIFYNQTLFTIVQE